MHKKKVPFSVVRQLLAKKKIEINFQDYVILDLNQCKLSEIPEFVFRFTNLEVLILSNNQISKIPTRIKGLAGLKVLILKNNYLDELPKDIGSLKNLQSLHLGSNNFSSFPIDVIQKLPNIKRLWLNNNKIKDVPYNDLAKLQKLVKLYIKENPLSYTDSYISFFLGEDILMDYLRSYKTNHLNIETKKVHLREIHLENIGPFKEVDLHLDKNITCIVGKNGSGKTILLRSIALGLVGYDRKRQIGISEDRVKELQKIENSIASIPDTEDELISREKGKIFLNYKVDNYTFKNVIVIDEEERQNPVWNITSENQKALFDNHNRTRIPIIGFGQSRVGNDSSNNDFSALINNIGDNRLSKFSHWIVSNNNIYNEYKDNRKQAEAEKYKQKIDITFKMISEILNEQIEFYRRMGKEMIVKTQINPDGIPARLLSLGFQNALGWIGYFIQAMSEHYKNSEEFWNENAICLIDEIDLYLHPQWQYSPLKVLSEKFCNTQFIVTTHSPLILSNLHQNQIHILNNDCTISKPQFETYGAPVERLLKLVMDTTERPYWVQYKLDKYIRLIEDSQSDADLEKAIEYKEAELSEIDNYDPILMNGQVMLNMKMKFAK